MSGDKWILEGHEAVPADLMTWAKWYETADRHVGRHEHGGVCVSTVFLGIDHRLGDEGPPLIFETMIFGGEHDQWQDRCSTWAEAVEMHKKACALAGVPLEDDYGVTRH